MSHPGNSSFTKRRRTWIAALLMIMIWTANNDEAVSVRQLAIGYFNYNGAENCPLNQLSAAQKNQLLPAYIRAIQDLANAGVRHNASIGIKPREGLSSAGEWRFH
jgi:hypothetical protein